MSFNKDLFSENFKNKDYDMCISMLRREIIGILTKRIQEKNPDFKYISVLSLKNNCFKYLSELEQEISIELYTFSFNEESSEFELSCMMEMYQTLTKN